MGSLYVTIVILVVVILGMIVILKEISQQYRKKSILSKTALRWKLATMVLGVFLAVTKPLKIITLLK